MGELLAKVDELGIADNTIVMFTSDNGAEIFSWPDGGNHPFRGEKGTVYEGGFRVPMLVKWPGVITPGTIINELCSLIRNSDSPRAAHHFAVASLACTSASQSRTTCT